MLALTHGRSYVCHSRPGSRDKMGEDFDATGHLSRSVFDEVGIPREADVYLCGPTRFMADMKEVLAALGVAPEQIHVEIFNGSESMTPGVVGVATRAPHLPKDDANTGPLVSFARSGIAVHWKASAYQSILELAEACDVPVRWSVLRYPRSKFTPTRGLQWRNADDDQRQTQKPSPWSRRLSSRRRRQRKARHPTARRSGTMLSARSGPTSSEAANSCWKPTAARLASSGACRRVRSPAGGQGAG